MNRVNLAATAAAVLLRGGGVDGGVGGWVKCPSPSPPGLPSGMKIGAMATKPSGREVG